MSTISKILILAILFLAVSLAVGYEYVLIHQARMTAAESRLTMATRLGNDNWTMSIKKIQTENKEDLKVIEAASLTKTGLISLIDILEATGKASGLKVSISSISSDAGAATPAGTPEVVRMSIETTGSWDASLNFIHLLESLPYKVSIDDTALSALDTDWRTSINMRITTFSQNL